MMVSESSELSACDGLIKPAIGSHALVAVMQNREVIIYSLPALEPMHTFHLSKRPNS